MTLDGLMGKGRAGKSVGAAAPVDAGQKVGPDSKSKGEGVGRWAGRGRGVALCDLVSVSPSVQPTLEASTPQKTLYTDSAGLIWYPPLKTGAGHAACMRLVTRDDVMNWHR